MGICDVARKTALPHSGVDSAPARLLGLSSSGKSGSSKRLAKVARRKGVCVGLMLENTLNFNDGKF